MTLRARASALLILAVCAFGAPAMAKPSDWADVVEKPGERSALPSPSSNAPRMVASESKAAKKERGGKKAKAKKAPRRGKAKRGRH